MEHLRLPSRIDSVHWAPQPNVLAVYVASVVPDPVTSVLAVVRSPLDKVLLVHVKSRGWDLPGGHREATETPHEAIVREAMEEASAQIDKVQLRGYLHLHVSGPVPPDYRYPHPDSHIALFEAQAQQHVPRATMECDGAEWVAPQEVLRRCATRPWMALFEYLEHEQALRSASPRERATLIWRRLVLDGSAGVAAREVLIRNGAGPGWARDPHSIDREIWQRRLTGFSCWDLSVALIERLRRWEIPARLIVGRGAEDNASPEPHGLVLADIGGAQYLLDPYFGIPPLPLLGGAAKGMGSVARLEQDEEGHLLVVQHVAKGNRRYVYRLDTRKLTETQQARLIDEATDYDAQRVRPQVRVTDGDTTWMVRDEEANVTLRQVPNKPSWRNMPESEMVGSFSNYVDALVAVGDLWNKRIQSEQATADSEPPEAELPTARLVWQADAWLSGLGLGLFAVGGLLAARGAYWASVAPFVGGVVTVFAAWVASL